MAVRFFRVYKDGWFRDQREPWTNLWMYDGFNPAGAGSDTPGSIRDVEGQILDAERAIHSNKVNFLRVESGLIRPPRGNEKYPVPGQVDYEREFPANTTGQLTTAAQSEPQEWTVMVQARLSKRGWLRKYFHTGEGSLGALANGTDPWVWSQAKADAAQLVCQNLNTVGEAVTGQLHKICNSRGSTVADSDWTALRRGVFHELKY